MDPQPTIFECNLKFILTVRGDFSREQVEKYVAKLSGMKSLIEEQLRTVTGMQDMPIIKLTDQVTLKWLVTEPRLRKGGLPWD
jgi:hypothetical protein